MHSFKDFYKQKIDFDSQTEEIFYNFLMSYTKDGKHCYTIKYHPKLQVSPYKTYEIDFAITHIDFPDTTIFVDIDGKCHEFFYGEKLKKDLERKKILKDKYRNYICLKAYGKFNNEPGLLEQMEMEVYDTARFLKNKNWIEKKLRDRLFTKYIDGNITMGGAKRWNENVNPNDTI